MNRCIHARLCSSRARERTAEGRLSSSRRRFQPRPTISSGDIDSSILPSPLFNEPICLSACECILFPRMILTSQYERCTRDHSLYSESAQMLKYDTLIRNATVLDGSGDAAQRLDVALRDGRIVEIRESLRGTAAQIVEAEGLCLAPGFIDVHTHDDTSVIEAPEMLAKISQGVTTVIVGNCGISAAPVRLNGDPPDPMTLLGGRDFFRYPTFADYIAALGNAKPTVNVAALIGHTSLRSNPMDSLDRVPSAEEVNAMRTELSAALDAGALGLSS